MSIQLSSVTGISLIIVFPSVSTSDGHPATAPYHTIEAKKKKSCKARKMEFAGNAGVMQISAHPAYTGSLLRRNRPDPLLMSSGPTGGVIPAMMIPVFPSSPHVAREIAGVRRQRDH